MSTAAVDMRNLYFSAAMDRGLDVNEAARFFEQNPADLVALSFMTYEECRTVPFVAK